MPDRLRLGVVGTSHWAAAAHVRGARTSTAELVGIWGRNAVAREQIAEENGILAFPTLEQLLDGVDAVSVAVPPAVQPGIAMRVARAGKHVILEKPLALTLREAQEVTRELTLRGLASLVFFTRRFVPEIESAIAEARTLRWASARVRALNPAMRDGSPYAASAWRREPGIVLWEVAPHVLSVLLPVLGPVREARAAPERNQLQVLTMVHESGARSEICMSLYADSLVNDYQLIAPDGSVLVMPDPVFERQSAFARAVDRLAAMVSAGSARSELSAAFGAEVTRILELAQETGRS